MRKSKQPVAPKVGGLVLTAAEARALRAIVRYGFETEARHFAECEPDERTGHIFEDIRTVALACGETTADAMAAFDADLAAAEEVSS